LKLIDGQEPGRTLSVEGWKGVISTMARFLKPDTAAPGEFEQRLNGATLLTAEVLYYMPDHPKIVQTFLWQTLDVAPQFPRLAKFLDFWRREIDAVIREVRVAHGQSLAPQTWRNVDGEFRIH
jgi:uncharacterized protein Usg